MQQYPDIDRTLIEAHIRLGYTQDEIKNVLKVLRLNASTANIEPDDPEWVPWINRGLAAIKRRFQNVLNNGQYEALFDVPYGLGGAHGQIDVGTRHMIIEAKVDRVDSGENRQIGLDLKNDIMNPPDANGRRKFVVLYAPGYGDSAAASIRKIGGYVVKSCKQLHDQIRQLGGT